MGNTLIREKDGWDISVIKRVELNVLKWCGYVEMSGRKWTPSSSSFYMGLKL